MMNNININHTRKGVSRNALTFTFIPAIIFALSFILFGCSEDDGGGDGSLISCRTDSACVEVSADACLELGGQKVQSCEAISSSSDGKEPSSSSGGNNISSSSEEDPVAGSSSSSDEVSGSSSSSDDSQSSSSSEGSAVVCDAGTVKIGEQCWMKKNLNKVPTAGTNNAATNFWCYSNNNDNCETYGRLYDWATAMALPVKCNSTLSTSNADCAIDGPHQGICPEGFHIPTNADWDELFKYIDEQEGGEGSGTPYDSETAGKYLKATSGWSSNGNGTDKYGFSALPGGYRDYDGSFNYAGNHGYWWSSSEGNSFNAYYRDVYYNDEYVIWGNSLKSTGFSVRCLQD